MKRLLLLSLLSLSCASKTVIPNLEYRTLYIDPDKPGLFYNYCVKRAWLGDRCKKWQRDEYDLTDKKMREKLINMGFKLKVIKY